MSISKIAFSSDDLRADVDDEVTFKRWRDIYCASIGEADIERVPDRSFLARCEFMQIGGVGLTRFDATLRRVSRTARQVASDQRNDFFMGFNHGDQQFLEQRGQETTGPSVFFTNGEPINSHMTGSCSIVGISIPRALVLELVPGAEDLIAQALTDSEATRYLDRYIDFLLSSDFIASDGPLTEKIEQALVDLVALSLGAARDAQELARMRGLRASRLQAILASIKLGFCNPTFSVRDVAVPLGLTPRYVQNLLSETNASFSERVLELRLQKARAMLIDLRSRLKVSDIAYACGFSEVSYFNRCFRRRFGASPTEYRGGGNGNANGTDPDNP